MKGHTAAKPLTKSFAIVIQQEHLAKWQKVLKPECFLKLKTWAEETNAKESDPYFIRRGMDLSQFVSELMYEA